MALQPGPQLLAGLGCVCRSKAELPGSQQQRALVAAAAAHLFRAAAGLSDPSATTLRGILQSLTHDLLGPEVVFEQPLPLMLLRYLEVAMALMEREQAAEGALLFARAAVEQVAAAYDGEQGAERLQREGARLAGADTCLLGCRCRHDMMCAALWAWCQRHLHRLCNCGASHVLQLPACLRRHLPSATQAAADMELLTLRCQWHADATLVLPLRRLPVVTCVPQRLRHGAVPGCLHSHRLQPAAQQGA